MAPLWLALTEYSPTNVEGASAKLTVIEDLILIHCMKRCRLSSHHSAVLPTICVDEQKHVTGIIIVASPKPTMLLFKKGDDLRQDQLTVQFLRTLNRIWVRCVITHTYMRHDIKKGTIRVTIQRHITYCSLLNTPCLT